MLPHIGLNATFNNIVALPGSLALMSQSGAICAAILDWAKEKDIGFSSVLSLGNAVDIDFNDALDYFAADSKTKSILLYVEGIKRARQFLSSLQAASRVKPVVVIKGGRLQQGSRAALSHTGAIVGKDDVFDAALKRAGAVRVMSIQQIFSAAQLLASDYRTKGNRLAIITNGGGAGVMALVPNGSFASKARAPADAMPAKTIGKTSAAREKGIGHIGLVAAGFRLV